MGFVKLSLAFSFNDVKRNLLLIQTSNQLAVHATGFILSPICEVHNVEL